MAFQAAEALLPGAFTQSPISDARRSDACSEARASPPAGVIPEEASEKPPEGCRTTG